MRLVAWNCAGGLHGRKFEALLCLKPDIAVVSECARPETLKRKGCRLSACSAPPIWTGADSNRGLAVFFFNGACGHMHRCFKTGLLGILPVEIAAPRRFNLLAVWAPTGLRKAERGPVNEALDFYRGFLDEEDAVLAGDFNNNVCWDKPGWQSNHEDTVEVLESRGSVSAYHRKTGERQGKETGKTLRWRRNKAAGYHIDDIFIPRSWTEPDGAFDCRIEPFDGWAGAGLSDHVPVVLDAPAG